MKLFLNFKKLWKLSKEGLSRNCHLSYFKVRLRFNKDNELYARNVHSKIKFIVRFSNLSMLVCTLFPISVSLYFI